MKEALQLVPITLTKRQKQHILIMCRKLFPEFNLCYLEPINDVGLVCFDYTWYNGQGANIIHHTYVYIHWFELCMTHFAARILSPEDMTFYQTTGNFTYKHPADYLYEKFKKLKQ